ncbi:MAG: MFS transporter [Thermoplasmata archaeon]|nr:MAG: MFS transporter [Thermoplasmata archaeon]
MDNEDKDREEYEVTALEEVVEAEPVEAEPVEAEVLEPPEGEEKKGFFSQFPKLYWVADALELFERGAYYGMLAVMSVHMAHNLGIDAVTIGLLFSMLLFFSYFWPLFASALAEKFGYRQVIMVSFVLLISGYFMTSTLRAGSLGLFIVALLLMGFGAGTFKPLISATIAHVTKDAQRNLAYSLYYWFINFGAFIFPLILGFAFPAEDSYYYIFIVSGILICVNVGITLVWYSNPIEPQRDLSVPQAFRKIMPALQDKKFRTLLIIYSGFWFMYAVNHSFLPIYMLQFRRMPGWFTVQWLAIINPGTIIVVGPSLGKFLEKYKSLNVMMVGIIIYCIGVLLTFGSNSVELFITGIIVYSIGEFIVHPGFIAYTSKIAPKDKVAIYMGAIFVATGVGIVVGPAIMGVWYSNFVESAHMPKLFGTLIVAVGVLTFASFILYNRWINKLAKEEDPSFKEDTSMWSKMVTAVIAFMFIPIVIGVGYAGGTDTFYEIEEEEDGGPFDWADSYDLMDGEPLALDGDASENSQDEVTIIIEEENVKSISFTLTWNDEPADTGYENDPDEFSLSVETPNGTLFESEPDTSSSGTITIPISFNPDKPVFEEGTGTYVVTVICGECGDQHSIGPIGFFTQPDTGNTWDLSVEYEFYQKKE